MHACKEILTKLFDAEPALMNLFDHVQVIDAATKERSSWFQVKFRFSAAGQTFEIAHMVDGEDDEMIALCASQAKDAHRRRIAEVGAQFSTPRPLADGGDDGRV